MPGDMWDKTGQKKELRKGLLIFLPLLSEAPVFGSSDRNHCYLLAIALRKCKVALPMSDGTLHGDLF